jgi:murein DD-endopeptidase MepM/ murein hydrolase activator NlpD
MRRTLLLAVLAASLVPGVAAATPMPMPVQVQLSLRALLENMEKLAPATPDVSILTTEPVSRSESSGYGWREDPIRKRQKFHHGTDYRGRHGRHGVQRTGPTPPLSADIAS